MTWLMRLEGAARTRGAEIEAARQTYRLLAEQAEARATPPRQRSTAGRSRPSVWPAWTGSELRGFLPRSETVAAVAAVAAGKTKASRSRRTPAGRFRPPPIQRT
jgi:hypothetical protein